MATAIHPAMTMPSSFNNQCLDPETDAFFDFSQLPSPSPSSGSRHPSNVASTLHSPSNTLMDEDLQTPAKPSHEYERFKQQTGLPSGSIAGLAQSSFNGGYSMFSSTGLDEMSMVGDSSMLDAGWASGTGLDMDMLSQPGFFYPSSHDASQSDDFIDPSAISQEEVPNIRVWPGMHQQQAQQQAQAKALAQAQQQRQQQIAQQQQQQKQNQQQQQQQQNRLHSHRKSASGPITDARTEETIARVVNQIRKSSQNGSLSQDPSNSLPHIIRMKKDEEDMDEDERLLASEEGKKLSSKERRQLRNKVSARAFRSRRKEYIGQLEGELAMKSNEANELRSQNRALMEENARSRAFIERLLRHQAFTPFLEELSRDESLDAKPTMQSLSSAPTPTPTSARKDINPYQGQQFGAMPHNEQTHIGMTLIPETPLDMSMLNLGTQNWGMNNLSSFSFQQPQVFAVLELPEGPSAPLDTQALSGKGYESFFSQEESTVEKVKADFPVVQRPIESSKAAVVEVEEEDDDPEFDLYRTLPTTSTTSAVSAPAEEQHEPLFGDISPEKAFAHFELFISDEAENERLMQRFERMCAMMEPTMQRIDALTSHLDL